MESLKNEKVIPPGCQTNAENEIPGRMITDFRKADALKGLVIAAFIILPSLASCAYWIHPEESDIPEEMVEVPAGWFIMGDEGGRSSNQPAHRVYLSRFAIDRFEVTNADYARYLDLEGLQAGRDMTDLLANPSKPVVGVLWVEANAYCLLHGKRLPTEAEWEKTARGIDGRSYPWGEHWIPRWANIAEAGMGQAMPVGSFPLSQSPYGALDMSGNAAEWVADYFDPDYYAYGSRINPRGPRQILNHGLRGGSWDSPAEQATTFFRNSSHSALPDPRVGFRCALSLTD
jgi:sulfatase modifying factor 1